MHELDLLAFQVLLMHIIICSTIYQKGGSSITVYLPIPNIQKVIQKLEWDMTSQLGPYKDDDFRLLLEITESFVLRG